MSLDFDDPFSAPPRVVAPPPPAPAPAALQPATTFEVVLPYPISANRYWGERVVTPKGGKPFVSHYVTPEARQYKEAVGWILRSKGVHSPLTCRVRVGLQLWPHRPQDWKTRAKKDPLYWADTVQRLDLDNARKVVTDALKGIAIEDDRQIWSDAGEVMEPDGREACLVLRITPLLKASPQEPLL